MQQLRCSRLGKMRNVALLGAAFFYLISNYFTKHLFYKYILIIFVYNYERSDIASQLLNINIMFAIMEKMEWNDTSYNWEKVYFGVEYYTEKQLKSEYKNSRIYEISLSKEECEKTLDNMTGAVN